MIVSTRGKNENLRAAATRGSSHGSRTSPEKFGVKHADKVVEIRSYYEQGCRVTDISKFLGIPYMSTYFIYKNLNWRQEMSNRDSRIKKTPDTTRASRTRLENQKKVEENAILSSQEGSDEMFIDEFSFEALPNPNKEGVADPNFHFFWATTTNPQDSPHRRMRMGYQLVKSEERPEFGHLRLKSGEFEGVISMNEMVLMKIPMDRYQQMMRFMHHTRPNEEASRLKAQARLGHVDKGGRSLDYDLQEDEGYKDLDKSHQVPSVFE